MSKETRPYIKKETDPTPQTTALKAKYRSMFGNNQYGKDMIAWRLLCNEHIALMISTNKSDTELTRMHAIREEMDKLSAVTNAETDYRISQTEDREK